MTPVIDPAALDWRQYRMWRDRKDRLRACAVCRRLLPLVDRPELRALLDATEDFADGKLTAEELGAARTRAEPAFQSFRTHKYLDGLAGCFFMASRVIEPVRINAPAELTGETRTVDPYDFGTLLAVAAGSLELLGRSEPRVTLDYVELCDELAHRPVAFDPVWRTDTVLALARQMYEAREFGAVPILADALQDAGCDNADILRHCRDAGATHVRGCWVVDLVLGKE